VTGHGQINGPKPTPYSPVVLSLFLQPCIHVFYEI